MADVELIDDETARRKRRALERRAKVLAGSASRMAKVEGRPEQPIVAPLPNDALGAEDLIAAMTTSAALPADRDVLTTAMDQAAGPKSATAVAAAWRDIMLFALSLAIGITGISLSALLAIHIAVYIAGALLDRPAVVASHSIDQAPWMAFAERAEQWLAAYGAIHLAIDHACLALFVQVLLSPGVAPS